MTNSSDKINDLIAENSRLREKVVSLVKENLKLLSLTEGDFYIEEDSNFFYIYSKDDIPHLPYISIRKKSNDEEYSRKLIYDILIKLNGI